jgi:AraC-like DNA-binding protein
VSAAGQSGPVVPHVLAQALGVAVLDYRCRAGVHDRGPEEHNQDASIVFVRRGVFARTAHGEGHIADANHVLFFNARQPYHIAHPVEGGDDCTILALSEPVVRALVERHAPQDADRAQPLFRTRQALSTPRALRLQYELLARARSGQRLDLEDTLAELLDEAHRGTSGAPEAASGSRAIARHRELVEAAQVEIHRDLAAPPSLSELAAALACSPFHLSRVFPQVAGLSLRAYLSRLRARAAAERLTQGARDLTELALSLGYADHSHFTNSFHREWGVPPSVFRARSAP